MIFYKFEGTGNDFILVDNRTSNIELTPTIIKKLCERNFGIGADGLLLIDDTDDADFFMRSYNVDGSLNPMCGNGGRCAVLFAYQTGIFNGNTTTFLASDGLHKAKIVNSNTVALQMNLSPKHEIVGNAYLINSGCPHFVRFIHNVDSVNVKREGRIIRNSAQFRKEGINVNFVEERNVRQFAIRTYERGVENETLSCGTGVTASAVAQFLKNNLRNNQSFSVLTLGGNLEVEIHANHKTIEDVWLIGHAREVFIGEINIHQF